MARHIRICDLLSSFEVFVPESANAGVLFGVGACVEIVTSADLSQFEATFPNSVCFPCSLNSPLWIESYSICARAKVLNSDSELRCSIWAKRNSN